jgi:N-acetylmuramoyl-L-alanine amidase
MATIVIDPGHGGASNIGGSDANHAVGPSGLLEKTITLDIAKRVKAALEEAGHTIVMTRSDDSNLSLAKRAGTAKAIKAPVFVSIHFNGFNGKAQGTETFCHLDHLTKSAALCVAVQAEAVKATGLNDRNAGYPGGVKTLALGVLNPNSHHSNTACVLVEVSFMDVPTEDARLQTAAYKDRVAAGIAKGIRTYLASVPGAGVESVVPARREMQDGFQALALEARALQRAAKKPRKRA